MEPNSEQERGTRNSERGTSDALPVRYTVRHVTRFTYDVPIAESVMEARMQPRSDGLQRCLHFALTAMPRARVMMFRDHDGNTIHHFDIPVRHARLTLTAEALVECVSPNPLPDAVDRESWSTLDAVAESGEYWECLAPSTYARTSSSLRALSTEMRLGRDQDPLTLLRGMMSHIHEHFEYRPQSTRVDSPIDEALESRQGVCQDFAHIFIALAREAGIPARYVSGYLFHDPRSEDRSATDATHAWAEAYVPEHGWIGCDPTNNLFAEERHIRVAIGRDYADVPPTRGVYTGVTTVKSELAVGVQVGPVSIRDEQLPFTPWLSREASAPLGDSQHSDQQ